MPKDHGPCFSCADFLEFHSNFSFQRCYQKASSSSTTMMCRLSEDFEIKNSLIRLVISTCTLKSHCVFQWFRLNVLVVVAHLLSRNCRPVLRVMCRCASRENLKWKNHKANKLTGIWNIRSSSLNNGGGFLFVPFCMKWYSIYRDSIKRIIHGRNTNFIFQCSTR